MEDLFFIQNLLETEKMDILSEVMFKMYRVSHLFSLAYDGKGDVLDVGNPSKERDIWKGKCKFMEKNWFYF